MKMTRTFLTATTVGFSFAWLLIVSDSPVLADQIWAQRNDGPGHGDDFANAVAVDGAGNVVVTGGFAQGERRP